MKAWRASHARRVPRFMRLRIAFAVKSSDHPFNSRETCFLGIFVRIQFHRRAGSRRLLKVRECSSRRSCGCRVTFSLALHLQISFRFRRTATPSYRMGMDQGLDAVQGRFRQSHPSVPSSPVSAAGVGGRATRRPLHHALRHASPLRVLRVVHLRHREGNSLEAGRPVGGGLHRAVSRVFLPFPGISHG